MFGKLTLPGRMDLSDGVRQSLWRARLEAVQLRHGQVGNEHLLLALLRIAPPGVLRMLQRLSVDPRDLTGALETALQPGNEGEAKTDPNSLPYTRSAKHVIEQMMKEAHAARQTTATPQHLFLALLAEKRGIASEVCRRLGVTLEEARAVVYELAADSDARVLVRIDDGSEQSIYEQIVAQVQEQVATGDLLPGERLPPVRRLADQLDIAPGTVARAYTELEQLGVVVTEGARGTRVADRKPASARDDDPSEALVGLLRPVVVAGFHLGATADRLRASLEEAMKDIFSEGSKSSS